MTNALEIRHLTKQYPGFTLEDINLNLPKGCIVGLIGENGAGKSTTIRLILDMIRPTAGEIDILGKSNRVEFAKTKEEIGVVLDEFGYPGQMNARQLNRILKYTYSNWDEGVFAALLERFSLPVEKKCREFSLGMRKKLSIAAALSHHPKLLILDEATSGLDPVARDEVTDLLLEFTRNEEHSILISSHIVSDLEKLCDYIAFIHKGRLTLFQEKDRLLEEYGMLRCTAEQISQLAPDAIHGRKDTPYGVEAVVERDKIPAGWELSPVGIEELFIYMTKGEP